MRILKILFFCFVSAALSAQNTQKIPQQVYDYLKTNQFEKIFQMIDSTHIPKMVMDIQKEKLQTALTEYGKPKKLETIIEQEAGVKKQYALPIQFKKAKKNLFIVLNSNQKIEQLKITDYSLNPFFQLQGYKGFSEVTDLYTPIKCKDGVILGANIAFGDTSKQKSTCCYLSSWLRLS